MSETNNIHPITDLLSYSTACPKSKTIIIQNIDLRSCSTACPMCKTELIHPITDLLSCSTACPKSKTILIQNIDLLSCSTACPMCKTELFHQNTGPLSYSVQKTSMPLMLVHLSESGLFYLYYIYLSTFFPMSTLSSSMLMFPLQTGIRVVLQLLSVLKLYVFLNALMTLPPFSGEWVKNCCVFLILSYIIFLGPDFCICELRLHVYEMSGCNALYYTSTAHFFLPCFRSSCSVFIFTNSYFALCKPCWWWKFTALPLCLRPTLHCVKAEHLEQRQLSPLCCICRQHGS